MRGALQHIENGSGLFIDKKRKSCHPKLNPITQLADERGSKTRENGEMEKKMLEGMDGKGNLDGKNVKCENNVIGSVGPKK